MLNKTPVTSAIDRPIDARLLALRIGLLAAGLLFFDVGFGLWEQGQAFVYPPVGLLSVLAWIAGVLTSVLALSVTSDRRWTWLALFSMIAFGLHIFYLNAQNTTPLTLDRTDNEMIGKFALEALKHGQNPYSWNFSDIVRVYENSGTTRTPFLDGSYQNRLTYPALPTLILWAFDRIGLGQARIVNLIFYTFLLVLMFVSAPRSLRPLILLPLAAMKLFTEIALSGAQDVVWSALLVSMILAWRRPLWRAVLFGLAVSFHQQPWFIAPFLVLTLWQARGTAIERLRRIAVFIGISGGLFVAINLPFMISDFTGWRQGVFEPAYAAFNMYSQGLGVLSMYGIASLPRDFYTLLQVSFFGCALLVYWRHPRAIGPAVWIVPGIFFWLYYRGLSNYWLFWIPPLLVALTSQPLFGGIRFFDIPAKRRASLTAVLVAGVAFVSVGVGLRYLTAPALITLVARPPFLTTYGGGWIGQLDVTVSNTSTALFSPRFAVQSEPGGQALPWTILTGPESLMPGATGMYTISADTVPSKAIPINQSAQIVVSDAGGNYALRALLTIPAQTNPAAIDPIDNPAFTAWPIDASTPQDWQLQPPPQTQIDMAIVSTAGHDALTLTLQRIPDSPTLIPLRLSQIVAFPRQFSLWVYPPHAMTQPLTDAYGIEINDGTHRLWIVFGGERNYMAIDPAGPIVAYMAAPSNVWSEQAIDLAGLYAQIGWPLPAFSTRIRNGVVYQARQVQFSLIVGSTTQLETIWRFGGIKQLASITDFNQVITDTLDRPDIYYERLFHQYLAQGNVDLAIKAWLNALFLRLEAMSLLVPPMESSLLDS
ncbi:MAG: hypothetical protein ACYDEO_28050 [Aggregatilineales bacterium]